MWWCINGVFQKYQARGEGVSRKRTICRFITNQRFGVCNPLTRSLQKANTLTHVEFLLEHRKDGTAVVHLTFAPDDSSTTFSDAIALAENAGPDATVWVHGTTPDRRAHLERVGLVSDRTLLKMQCSLPTPPPSIETVSFTEADIGEFVAVNNRAFSWHPEQSGLTPEAVRTEMTEPWFDAEGFRLHRIDGQLAGFCWTKIHEIDDLATGPVGEIYVIAVDPQFHGQGLGKALTLAGLDHIAGLGIRTAILYVESDNDAAVATYEKLGFTVGREDSLWTRSGKDT